MYELLRSLGWARLVKEQGPSLLVAWVIAEFFYKFHSFTLECAAFLLTWFAIDLILWLLIPARRRRGAGSE